MTARARKKLSEGSIKAYIDNLAICLVFIVLFSLWQSIRTIMDFNIYLGSFSGYPEIIFIILAYAGFIFASYRVSKISHEFGFIDEGKKINNILRESAKEKKKKIKRKKTKRKVRKS